MARQLQQAAGNQATQQLVQRAGPEAKQDEPVTFYAFWAKMVTGMLINKAAPILIAASGIRDENKLTNLLFWAANPELMGQRIPEGRKELERQWIRFRNDTVRPALADRPTDVPKAPSPTPAPVGPTQTPTPSPTPDPVGPTPAPGGPTPEPRGPVPDSPAPSPPTRVAPPASGSPILDSELHEYLAAFPAPLVAEIDGDIARLENLSVELAKKRDDRKGEEAGEGRDELVAGLGEIRAKVGRFAAAGIPAAQLPTLQARINRAVADLTPYYSQGQNVDLLEGFARATELGEETTVKTRTCNLTALSMCLEQLGKSAADYAGPEDKLLVAAQRFSPIMGTAKHRVGEKGNDLSTLHGLRLPDFIQLVAIAQQMKAATSEAADQAVHVAWGKILNIYYLQKLAEAFDASASVKLFTLNADAFAANAQAQREIRKKRRRDRSKAEKQKLRGLENEKRSDYNALVKAAGSKSRRRNVLKLAAARRQLSEVSTEKARAAADKRVAKLEKGLGDVATDKDEERIPVDAYRAAVLDQVGPELDAGKAVIVSVTGHYLRLQNLTVDRIFVDDSANFINYDISVSYEEARAAGFFKRRVVIS